MRKGQKSLHIEIPKPLIFEVDKIVTKSELYSDNIEFVTDAVRRLILESKEGNMDILSQDKSDEFKNDLNIEKVGHKRNFHHASSLEGEI